LTLEVRVSSAVQPDIAPVGKISQQVDQRFAALP
jgi:hypothetical protein